MAALRLTLLPLLLALVSCSLLYRGDEEQWVHEIVQDGPPLRDLLSDCEWATIEAGYPPGDVDDAGAVVTSGWLVEQHPFSNRGRRYQGILEIEPLGDPGLYRVSSRVRVQANREVYETLDLSEADWESIEDDPARARTLLQHLIGRVRTPGRSDGGRRPWREEVDRG